MTSPSSSMSISESTSPSNATREVTLHKITCTYVFHSCMQQTAPSSCVLDEGLMGARVSRSCVRIIVDSA